MLVFLYEQVKEAYMTWLVLVASCVCCWFLMPYLFGKRVTTFREVWLMGLALVLMVAAALYAVHSFLELVSFVRF